MKPIKIRTTKDDDVPIIFELDSFEKCLLHCDLISLLHEMYPEAGFRTISKRARQYQTNAERLVSQGACKLVPNLVYTNEGTKNHTD